MNDLLTSKLTNDLRSLRVEKRPLALFTGGSLGSGRLVGPARALQQLCPEQVVAIVDDQASRRQLVDVPSWARGIPIVDDVVDLPESIHDVFIGLALPRGKVLLRHHRTMLERGAQRGLQIWSGLERSIRHDRITDLRQFGPAERVTVSTEAASSRRLLLYQTTPATSSTVVASELADALTAGDVVADWLPSSPAGMLCRGFGRTLDRVPARIAPGLVQRLIQTIEPQANLIVVEGEGALDDPQDSALIAARTFGTAPSFHAVVHRVETGSPERGSVETGSVETGSTETGSTETGSAASSNVETSSVAAGSGERNRGRRQDFDLENEIDNLLSRLDGLHQSCGHRSTMVGVGLYSTEADPWALKELQAAIRDRGFVCVDLEQDGVGLLADAARGLLP